MSNSFIIGLIAFLTFPFWMSLIGGILKDVLLFLEMKDPSPKDICAQCGLCGLIFGLYVRLIMELWPWLMEYALATGFVFFIIQLYPLVMCKNMLVALYDTLYQNWNAHNN